MIVYAEFQYYDEAWKNLDPDKYELLRKKIPGLPEFEEKQHAYDKYLIDEEGLRLCAEFGLRVTLTSATNNCMLVKLQDRIAELEKQFSSFDRHSEADLAVNGGMVQIHIPDMQLWFVNQVTYLEDACTDKLQDMLNEGWHILAVCPPNAQRRPDYILGMAVPKHARD
jgi:hypothetical protein